MKEQSEKPETGIVKLKGMEEAQEYANMGYVVVGARKNTEGAQHPHFATVRPGCEYNNKNGTMIANVGIKTQTTNEIKATDVFKNIADVGWYYNSKQKFIANFTKIIEWEARGG